MTNILSSIANTLSGNTPNNTNAPNATAAPNSTKARVQSVLGSFQNAADEITKNERAAMASETKDAPTFDEQQAQIAASAQRNAPITQPAFTPVVPSFTPAAGHRSPLPFEPNVDNQLG